MTPEERWAVISHELLEGGVANRVRRLRDLADSIEREAARDIDAARTGRHEWSSYTRVASQLVHAVTWGIANLNLSDLIEAGHDADKARQGLKP